MLFTKMQASGNDFILIENFEGAISPKEAPELARKLCRRRISVGADGLILIEPPRNPRNAFSWRFFNADGTEAEMCGNGGRCAARFVVEEGLSGPELTFETPAGEIRAEVRGKRVKVALTPPRDLRLNLSLPLGDNTFSLHFINTGVPHAVIFVKDLEEIPVEDLGRRIRFHEHFAPAGVNVNFVRILSRTEIAVRTYERGVEGETLACGTGASAAAYIAVKLGLVEVPVSVITRSGETLRIHLEENRIFLEGDTHKVYRGYLYSEALSD
ncbi:diaminopimelate epimerase [Thermosulfurimonas sp. F29]|uniref:diaminopimelate epimerase n=1 Tax=Thermosulfurimonas sp. F29 TaxID=2867247 RepID=UPI00351D6754